MTKVFLKNSKSAFLLSAKVVMMAIAVSMFFTSCEKDDPKSTEADFIAFTFDGIVGSATINKDAKTIVAMANASVDLATMKPVFTISAGATATVNGVTQTSGSSSNNFAVPVIYSVTAEDGTTVKHWTVTITKEGGATGTEANFLTFTFDGIIGVATIDQNTGTINAKATSAFDLTAVKPTFTLSPNATVTVNGVPQTSGVTTNNFATPLDYYVTSGDGSNTKKWTVTITKEGDVVTELTNDMINTGDKILAPGVYLIPSWLSLNDNNKLTISPGTTIRMGTNAYFSISNNGTLIAKGTEALPIIFTSDRSAPKPGDWNNVGIGQCDGSVLEYCIFEYGGSSDYYGMVHVGCEMTINNCTFKDSKYTGLTVRNDGGFVEFKNNTFINCADSDVDQHPMYVNNSFSNLRNIGTGNTFSNTEPNKGIMVDAGTLSRNVTLEYVNAPYFLKNWHTINSTNSATLTIKAGVQIKMMSDSYISIENNGKLVAQGTADNRIKITGVNDQKGYWQNIHFNSNALEGNILEYCDIMNGGKSDYWAGIVLVNGTRADQVTIRNCHIAKSLYYGIYFMNNGEAVLEGNTFADCNSGETNKP
ncbi:MAG: DUF5018 domain-containing protein [Bacteroidales bacterium]|nr:DUF5018 domain-containing protein [Bacteroidales bacterium]